jgi:type VI protein secretion system component Hcp
MAEHHNDLLMRFVRSNGQELEAECSASINANDDLTDDFVRGKFFEVQEFGFGAGLDDDEAPKEPPEPKVEPGKKPPKTAPKPFKLKYARFMKSGKSRGYPVDIDEISFTRLMDRGSTVFFQDMCDLKTFEQATLVKRRTVGSAQGLQTYLRMDFTDVLLVGIEWEEGELTITEKYKFICRGVMVQYKPQNSDGSLGAAIPGGWPQG